MKVGSINGACAVGGRNGVGLGAEEQAVVMRALISMSSRPTLHRIDWSRLNILRSISLNKKRATVLSPFRSLLFFFFA